MLVTSKKKVPLFKTTELCVILCLFVHPFCLSMSILYVFQHHKNMEKTNWDPLPSNIKSSSGKIGKCISRTTKRVTSQRKRQSESRPPPRCWYRRPVWLASVKKGVKIATGQRVSSGYTRQIQFLLGTKAAPRGQ